MKTCPVSVLIKRRVGEYPPSLDFLRETEGFLTMTFGWPTTRGKTSHFLA